MTLTIDTVNSPPVVTNSANTVATLTTASFTPPAGALILAVWAGNSTSPNNPGAPSITDNLGTPLTYTLTDWQSRADSPTRDGQAAAWWAVAGTSTAMTVTVTSGDVSNRHAALRVYVITGQHAVPIGAHGKSGSSLASGVGQPYTASATGGQGFISVCDWDAKGTMTAGTGCTIDAGSSGTVPTTQISYGFAQRTTADDTVGVSNTLAFNVGGGLNSTNLAWVWVEVLPALIWEDSSQPAVVTTNASATITTASFSPPANSLLVAQYVPDSAPSTLVTGSITDSLGGTWTLLKRANLNAALIGGAAEVWCRYLSSAPGAMTVSGTNSFGATGGGMLLVRVLNGAASVQNGATASIASSSVTPTVAVTATVVGSRVYASALFWTSATTQVANANSARTAEFLSSHATAYDAYKGRIDATSLTSTTYGFTNASGSYLMAAVEILPAGSAPDGSQTFPPPQLPPHLLLQLAAQNQQQWLGGTAPADVAVNADQAAVTVTASDAPVDVTANADVASVTVAATDVLTSAGANANQATVTAAATDGSATATANADQAAVTVVAPDAVAGLGALADVVAVTAAALDAPVTVTANADQAAVTAVAPDGLASVAVNADVAAVTVTAPDATASTATATNAPADAATVTVAATDASLDIKANADQAAVTTAATDGLAAITVNADQATVTAAATDATVSTAAITNAPAEAANVTAAATDAVAAVGANADQAAVTAAATDGAVDTKANADIAAVTATGPAAVADIQVGAGAASATAAATDGTAAITVNADVAPVTVTATDATVSTLAITNAPAEAATAVVTATDASVDARANADQAAASATATDGVAALAVAAGATSVGVVATDATVAFGAAAPAGAATVVAVANDASLTIQANAEAAAVLATAPTITILAPPGITTRPDTGTTARPGTGTTARPGTGTTGNWDLPHRQGGAPGRTTTARPYTGVTTEP